MHADDLLNAPRGLELCVELRDSGAALDRPLSERVLFDAIAQTTSSAMYWQEPRARELDCSELASELQPIAGAVIAALGSRWWSSPIARDDQHEVQFDDPTGLASPPAPPDVHEALVRWREEELADERFYAKQPADPATKSTGHWWSAPVAFGVPSSTRNLKETGPVGLSLVEDSMGWSSASSRMLNVHPDAKVFEIGGPEDWITLVDRYPLPVRHSRRSDWWRATGHELAWVIPDYLAAAEDFDAIHLTVSGYLLTAGRALRVDDSGTVLAGWPPDETCWLTSSAFTFGPSSTWTMDRSRGSLSWTRTSDLPFA